jgi:muconate cycloisomerase
MARIERLVFTEVIVPARAHAINSPGIDQPLHKLAVADQASWTKQFDELPKCLLELYLDDGTIGLGEFYRDHDWRILEGVAQRWIGLSLEELPRQSLPMAACREYDGFECALWDAFAKKSGLPLVELLGGKVRAQVKVGAWSGHRTVGEAGEMARRFQELGYDCTKFKCDLEDEVVGWCRQIAESAPGMKVILDPNERWERPAEVRCRLDGLREIGNVLCLEDPLPHWMWDEYARLRQYSPIAIVRHVSLPYLMHGQRVQDAIRALQAGAVDGFNFNAGLVRFQQLDRIAAAAGLLCWHGSEIDLGILEAMYVHQAAAAFSCSWPSDIFGRLIREHDLLATPLEINPPWAKLPSGPGLGVELDRSAIAFYQTAQRAFK